MRASAFVSRETVRVLLMVFGMLGLALLLAGLMLRFSVPGPLVLVEETFGVQLRITPTSAAVIIVALISGEIFLVFSLRGPHRRIESVVVVAFAVFSGTLALMLGRRLFLTYFPEAFAALTMLLAVSVFAGVYVMFLILIGECSERVKNAVLLVFSATGGVFFGTAFPSPVILLMLSVLIIVDLLLTHGRRTMPLRQREFEPAKTALTAGIWSIGLGDLLAYSLLMAHVFVSLGVFVLLVSLGLLLVGIVLTMRWAVKSSSPLVPGLVGTVGLGMIPLAISVLLFPPL